MSPIVKLPGRPVAKAKPVAKVAAAPKAKPVAKAKPAAKAKPKAKAKPRAKATPVNNGTQRVAKDGRVLRTPKDLDPRVLENFEGTLADAGTRVKEAKAEHDAAVEAVHGIVVQAQDAGIPMAIIEDVTGISRQWLYKMSQFKGRTASNGVQSKPAAAKKKPAAKPAAAKKPASTAKRAATVATQTAAKRGSGSSTVIKIA